MDSSQWDFIKTNLSDLKDDHKYLRDRLDSHIDEEEEKLNGIRKDVSCVRIQLEGHKGKLAAISAAIAIVISGVVTFILSLIPASK